MSEPITQRTDLRSAPYRGFEYPFLLNHPRRQGAWHASPETFRVDEIPAYPWCGEGEHAALMVEKAGLTTRELASAVARSLEVAPAAVGYAGMKDKHATTIQGFTVTGVATERAREAFVAAGGAVLEASRHRNKLRLGHLAGNRFRTWVAGADPGACQDTMEELRRQGVPNYYGPQRFGKSGDNAAAGLRVLQGKQRAKRWQKDLLTSALQSFVFNEVLARRLEAGVLGMAIEGDVLRREDSGGLFQCTDPTEDQPRVAGFEVTPTGPMPGRKMVAPTGEIAGRETAVLRDLGLEEGVFAPLRGTRRALRVRIEGADVEPGDGGVWLTFTLPPGAFATALLREVTE